MPLTPRFDELVKELNLPEAAWHLSRTNSGTEQNATTEEIEAGRQKILDLLSNHNNGVQVILSQVEAELEKIEPIEVLLEKRQQATLESWGKPVSDIKGRTEYSNIISQIQRRGLLEKTKKQAELILNGGFRVIQGNTQDQDSVGKRIQSSYLTIGKVEQLDQAA